LSSRKRRREGPLPASGAGLLRFFEDETKGVKIRPEIVIGLAVTLVILSILLRFAFPVG
jgi:preprotein translocase subunit Sec61beta